jgi:hypothetical protein
MAPARVNHVILNFAGIGKDAADKILANISAVAVAGAHLWTASDEHRSLQCFAPKGDRFALKQSVNLDDAIKQHLPHPPKEFDLEGLAFAGEHLWFCGSHCRSRDKAKHGESLDPKIKAASNRHVLGRIPLARDGTWTGKKGEALSSAGEGALRNMLRKDPFIAPFLDIPAKENGLDIEGIAGTDGRVLLGLRGPVIGGRAAIIELEISHRFKLTKVTMRFVDLGTLGIRDLHWDGRRLLVLAGPTFIADEPFRLFALAKSGKLSIVKDLLPSGPDDHPEAITILERRGRRGVLLLSDGKRRVRGLRYTADWYPL